MRDVLHSNKFIYFLTFLTYSGVVFMPRRNIKKDISEEKKECCCKGHHHGMGCHGACGGVYFMGIIAAAVYFISQTSGFWNVVLAILKAIVWPVFVIHALMGFIGV